MTNINPFQRYTDNDTVTSVLESSQNQAEFVDAMSKYSPDYAAQSQVTFSNIGLDSGEAFREEEVMQSSIFLALRSYTGTKQLMLICTHDHAFRSVPGIISSDISRTTRTELAKQLSKAMLSNDRLIGFNLKMNQTNSLSGNYTLELYELTDPSVRREELITEASLQMEEALQKVISEYEEQDAVAVPYGVIEKKRAEIRASLSWNPYYLVSFKA